MRILSFCSPNFKMAGLLGLSSFLAGCRLIGYTAIAVVGVVGLAGYAVYKTGETAVTGVGKVAKATGSGISKAAGATAGAFSSGTKSVATVVYKNGEYKTECPMKIESVWVAANTAFQKAEFKNVAGDRDAISGQLTAQTWDATAITLQVKSLDTHVTEMKIRVGVKGDLQTAETIHKLIEAELSKGVTI
jgi:hypothetical protein